VIINLILAIISFYFLGVSLEIILFSKKVDLLDLGNIFGLGFGGAFTLVVVFSSLGKKLGSFGALGCLGITLLMFFIALVFKRPTFKKVDFKKPRRIDIILVFLLLLFLGPIFFKTFSAPIWGYDAYAIWLARARAFFVDGGIDINNLKYFFPPEHPPMWSVICYWLFIFIGRIDFLAVRILPLLFYLLIIYSFYYKTKGKSMLKIIFFFFLLTIPQMIENVVNPLLAGNADLFAAFYVFLAVVNLLDKQWTKTGLFLGLASMVKSDVTPMLMLFVVGYWLLISKKKIKPIVTALLPLILLFIAKKALGISSRYLGFENIKLGMDYIFYDLMAFREEVRNIGNWNLVWWMYILGLFCFAKEIFKDRKILFANLLIIGQFLSYFLIFLITPENQAGQIATALFRLFLHLAPASMLIVYKLFDKNLSTIKKG